MANAQCPMTNGQLGRKIFEISRIRRNILIRDTTVGNLVFLCRNSCSDLGQLIHIGLACSEKHQNTEATAETPRAQRNIEILRELSAAKPQPKDRRHPCRPPAPSGAAATTWPGTPSGRRTHFVAACDQFELLQCREISKLLSRSFSASAMHRAA
jgi:hypothetical protein